MMQEWVAAAACHQAERRKECGRAGVWSCMLHNIPACTYMLIYGYYCRQWVVAHQSKEERRRVLCFSASHRVLVGSLWEQHIQDPFEVSSEDEWTAAGTLGPRRRAQPSLLPHPSTPKFHLLFIAPPFLPTAFKIKLQDLLTRIHPFSRYMLNIQAKNTEYMARSLSVAQRCSFREAWALQLLSCDTAIGSLCAATGRLLQVFGS